MDEDDESEGWPSYDSENVDNEQIDSSNIKLELEYIMQACTLIPQCYMLNNGS